MISQTRIKSRIYNITSYTIQGISVVDWWFQDYWIIENQLSPGFQWHSINEVIKTVYHTVCKTCSLCHFHYGNIKKDEKGPKGIMTKSAPKLFRIKELRYCCTND